MTNKEKVEELKQKLIGVLSEMNDIMPVQFHDVDCDGCVFNFSGVQVSEQDNRVYVQIAMWHDNLPAHRENPLKDGYGRVILPNNGNNVYAEDITDVVVVKFSNFGQDAVSTSVSDKMTKGALVSMLAAHRLPIAEAKDGEEVCISFMQEGEEHFASLSNKTSDVPAEWFTFDCADEIVTRSILDGVDHVLNYNDARLKAENKGINLSQQKYLEQIDKEENGKISSLLKQAEGGK